MHKKLLVVDSHPVQYRVPVWQAIERQHPGLLHVVYASDCSVKGHNDEGFGQLVRWSDPMLEGYSHTILNTENGKPLSGWNSLTGVGLDRVIEQVRPTAILLTGLNYRYDYVAYWEAHRRRIPLWLRCETQDQAFVRSGYKAALRGLFYRAAYSGIDHCFYIGELNRQHYLKHGVCPNRLTPALYGTVNRFSQLSELQKHGLRTARREQLNIPPEAVVIGFSGKFIPKKYPDSLYQMLPHLPESLRRRLWLYFIGSGELEPMLKQEAHQAQVTYGVQAHFSGFVNQTELAPHYLALDLLVLPSRRMGETWGLVANEALQAGCGVIVSDSVGSSANFGQWPRFRQFPTGDVQALAQAVLELTAFERDFNWATDRLYPYSIDTVADAIAGKLVSDFTYEDRPL